MSRSESALQLQLQWGEHIQSCAGVCVKTRDAERRPPRRWEAKRPRSNKHAFYANNICVVGGCGCVWVCVRLYIYIYMLDWIEYAAPACERTVSRVEWRRSPPAECRADASASRAPPRASFPGESAPENTENTHYTALGYSHVANSRYSISLFLTD